MLTDEHILQSLLKTNPRADIRDVNAARRFMKCFECEDAETYEEAKEKILASMRIVSDEMDKASNAGEMREILHRHYGKL